MRTHNWSGLQIDDLPNLQHWLTQIAARPAAQKGIAVPYEIKTMDHGQCEEARQLAIEIRKMVQR
jgi:GST-like protein